MEDKAEEVRKSGMLYVAREMVATMFLTSLSVHDLLTPIVLSIQYREKKKNNNLLLFASAQGYYADVSCWSLFHL